MPSEHAYDTSQNTGHGHVRPRPDGVKARCGGPGLCAVCMLEQRGLGPRPTGETPGKVEAIAYDALLEQHKGLRANRDRLAAALLELTLTADRYMLGDGNGELTGETLKRARAEFTRATAAAWDVIRADVEPTPIPATTEPVDEPDGPVPDPDHLADDAIDAALEGLVKAFQPLLVSLWQGGLAVGRADKVTAPSEVQQ